MRQVQQQLVEQKGVLYEQKFKIDSLKGKVERMKQGEGLLEDKLRNEVDKT